jgi:hypothetical protein
MTTDPTDGDVVRTCSLPRASPGGGKAHVERYKGFTGERTVLHSEMRQASSTNTCPLGHRHETSRAEGPDQEQALSYSIPEVWPAWSFRDAKQIQHGFHPANNLLRWEKRAISEPALLRSKRTKRRRVRVTLYSVGTQEFPLRKHPVVDAHERSGEGNGIFIFHEMGTRGRDSTWTAWPAPAAWARES